MSNTNAAVVDFPSPAPRPTGRKRFDNVLETIGRTPVIRINRLAPPGVNLYVKAEAFNPMGSVKDRMALAVIEAAERSGALKPGQTVIEATSGNTGIGLAMVCAAKGYPLVIVMAENFSIERRKILRFLGAKVVLTPAAHMGSGMVAKAEALAKMNDWFMVRQFENEANADAHTQTTAVEILQDFHDQPLDYFVTGYGTGGTLKGTARVLKRKSPQTRIVACEPDNSPLLASGIAQQRTADGQPSATHPSFRPHLMQGWTPDFIPRLTEDAVSSGLIDEIVSIDGNEALRYARELARQEGIFCGTSGGATFAGAIAVARTAPKGSTILCMLPDTGERYLSTPLFADIPVEMTDEELELSRSTVSRRSEVAACPVPDVAKEAVDPDTKRLFEGILADPAQPVVLFALQWCEFAWSVRKLFNALEVPFRSVDLDSVEYQQDDLGGKLRAVLTAHCRRDTIPQVFIGGEHLGGCREVFDSYEKGRLQVLLDANGLSPGSPSDLDASSLLPGWLQQR